MQKIRDTDLDEGPFTYQTTQGSVKTGVLRPVADDCAIHIYSEGNGVYYLKVGWHYQVMDEDDASDYADEIKNYYTEEAYLSCGDALSVVIEYSGLYIDPIDIIEFYFDEQKSYQPTRVMENGLQEICFHHLCREGPICYLTTRGDIRFGQLETIVDERQGTYAISLVSRGLCFLKIQFTDGDDVKSQEGIIYHGGEMSIIFDKRPENVGIVEFFVINETLK
jgi:hypothetical protein